MTNQEKPVSLRSMIYIFLIGGVSSEFGLLCYRRNERLGYVTLAQRRANPCWGVS